MKVMLIVPLLDQGGLERVCAATAQLLKEKYEVALVVFSTKGMIYDVSGVNLIDLGLGAAKGAPGKALTLAKRICRVRKLKREAGPALSYSFGTTANLVNVLSKSRDTVWAGIRGYGALEEHRKMRMICRLADAVVSCTKVMEADINTMFSPKRSFTLYNPCDLDSVRRLASEALPAQFTAFFEKRGKTVVSMGRAHEVKGFWHLLKCMKLVKEAEKDAKLVIIGDGDYGEYKALAEKLGIGESVLFTGVQKNPFRIVARCDVYALTSLSEGFPNALIEAMCAGVPAVAANCKTGPAEILHSDYRAVSDERRVHHADYGILTPVFSPRKDLNPEVFEEEEKTFAHALLELLQNEPLRLEYREKAAGRAADFGSQAYVKEIEKGMRL